MVASVCQAKEPDPQIYVRDCLRNGNLNSTDGELFCWHASSAAESFLDAYEAYKNPEWLAAAVKYYDFYLSKLEKDPDGYEGWIGNTIGNDPNVRGDALVGDAILCSPLVRFAEIVLADRSLTRRFGAKARQYMKLADRIVWEKQNVRGCYYEDNGLGSYHTHDKYIDKKTGQWVDRPMSVISDNLNKHYDAGLVILRLWRITGDEKYRDRVEAVFGRMKTMIRYYEDEDRYVWNYWMPHGPYDVEGNATKSWVGVHTYRAGYQAGEVSDFVEVYDSGLVFDKVDFERMIRTNHWMSTGKRDGSPGFRSADASSDAGTLWSALARFDPKIEKMYLQGLRSNNSPSSQIALDYYLNVQKPKGWERSLMKPGQEPRDYDFNLQPGEKISLALVIPSTVEIANNSRVRLTTKTLSKGRLRIELLAADSDEVLGVLHTQDMDQEGVFTAPTWDGTNPRTGKKEIGEYRIRWSIAGESRIEKVFVIEGEKKDSDDTITFGPGDKMMYNFEEDVDDKWQLQGAEYSTSVKHSGKRSLMLEQGHVAVLRFGEYENLPVRVSMWVYDNGAKFGSQSATGGGWGIETAAGDKFAVRTCWRGYLNGDNEYSWFNTGEGQWFSPHQTHVKKKKGWTQWVFDFTLPSAVTVSGNGQAVDPLVKKHTPEGAVAVFLIGGDAKVGPLYVDDITVTYPK